MADGSLTPSLRDGERETRPNDRGHTGASDIRLEFLPGAVPVGRAHRAAGAQPDNLCGPYWVATLLQAASEGGGGSEGSSVGHLLWPERVAVAARTSVPRGDPATWLPPGEPSRTSYRLPIPVATEATLSGTSVPGMLDAVEEVTEGAFRLLPLRGRQGRRFDAEAVEALLDLLFAHPTWEATPILNLRSGKLWGSRVPLVAALGFLWGEEATPPEPDWDVGHYLTVAGIVRGPRRSLVLVRDTYSSLGWDGYHLQPPEAVAAALRRDDGREGGCLLFLRARDHEEAERSFQEAGFVIGVWDNGTPYARGGG